MKARGFIPAVLIAGLTGCATPPFAARHETITRNVAYAKRGGLELHLDMYVPKQPRPAPVVVWFHGGAWKYGDKGFNLRIRNLTRFGIAVAAVEYRRSWQAKWPAQRDDCAEALSWLRRNGDRFGIDAARLGVSGDSSGGHIAALLGVVQGHPNIKAVCALYPPTDLVALGEYYAKYRRNLINQLFDAAIDKKRDVVFAASPINHVDRSSPPFLLLHGGRDPIVPIEQSRALHARLSAAGISSQLNEYPQQPHAFGLDETKLAEVAAFFQKNL